MDGENSYESDISESWSLIDINLNEELVTVANGQPESEENYLPDLKDVKLKKSDSKEIEDFVNVKPCSQSVTEFHRCCQSDSDSSLENHEILKIDESVRNFKENSIDSSDAESIEILARDGNHMDLETDRLCISIIDKQEHKNCTYQSDDEESWNGTIDYKVRNSSSTAIKQKRNLVRHSESSDSILNSDITSMLNNHTSNKKKFKVQSSTTSNQPVYKHYRNNVVNTVLSMSVGVIFAGVACIAIGHFLGVHDAAETAVELVDTLKKLQKENVALQSRLSQLNRAVLKRDVNSKFDLLPTKPQKTVSCEERLNYGSARTKSTNLNHAALSEIRSSLKSIQWLTKLDDMFSKNNGNDDSRIGFSSTGKYIRDQLNLLNNKKVEGIKLLEDSDKKISKVLQRIIERLSASQENIEKLYSRLTRLKDKVNYKLAVLFPDESQRSVPVTEKDLNSMQWYPIVESIDEESGKFRETVCEFIFPQPEEFYETKNESILIRKPRMTNHKIKNSINNNNNNYCNNISSNTCNDNDDDNGINKEKCNETQGEKNEKKIRKEGKRRRKGEKKCRREKSKDVKNKLQKKVKRDVKVFEKVSKRKQIPSEQGQIKYKMGKFNETKESYKRFPKEKDGEKTKRKIKRMKKSKTTRAVVTSKPKKGNGVKKNGRGRLCSRNNCFNVTGYNWVFRYANGREESRRHQTLGDWQFERAKGRKEQRDDYVVGNWQFRRALAREGKRNDYPWRPERSRRNYKSQDVFHEGFSWI